jgi:hypothetical protein
VDVRLSGSRPVQWLTDNAAPTNSARREQQSEHTSSSSCTGTLGGAEDGLLISCACWKCDTDSLFSDWVSRTRWLWSSSCSTCPTSCSGRPLVGVDMMESVNRLTNARARVSSIYSGMRIVRSSIESVTNFVL